MIHNFMSLLKHDILHGILLRWRYFLVAVLFFTFTDFAFMNNVNSLNLAADSVLKCSITDYILNMFIGNEPFDFELKKGISLSVVWFVFHAVLFSSMGFYITDDLNKNAFIFILKVKSRRKWWISKVVWCVLIVIIYYALFFIVSFIFAALFGTVSLSVNDLVVQRMFGFSVSGISIFDILLSSFFLPMAISCSFAVLEAALSLILKPLYSFLIIICYLIASTFYCRIYLLFNFSMIIRNNFYGINGVTNQYGILIAVILVVVSSVFGVFIIKRKNIL